MKKIILVALALAVSATITAQTKASKSKKKKAKIEAKVHQTYRPFQLYSPEDSVGYAAGYMPTYSLKGYLKQRLGVDTTYMDDFRRGFLDALNHGDDPQSKAYYAGIQIAAQVRDIAYPAQLEEFDGSRFNLTEKAFYQGFADGLINDTTIFTHEEAEIYFEAQKAEQERQRNSRYISQNTAWLAENSQREGVVTLPSGLQYRIIYQGDGKVAEQFDEVTVRYEGRLIDGTKFDSSYDRNPDTSTFMPAGVIKGWEEALCMMPEGSKWELYIPQELAYGSRATGKILPYSTLIFVVEVVSVKEAPPAPSIK